MKIFISIPMYGREVVDISRDMSIVEDEIIDRYPDAEIINTLSNELIIDDNIKNKRLYYLGDALKKLAKCDAIYFCKGWQYARGCRVEHEAAVLYKIPMIYQTN